MQQVSSTRGSDAQNRCPGVVVRGVRDHLRAHRDLRTAADGRSESFTALLDTDYRRPARQDCGRRARFHLSRREIVGPLPGTELRHEAHTVAVGRLHDVPSGTRFFGEPGDCLVDINAIAVDKSGAAYITGCTSATDFPLVNPFRSTPQGTRGSGFVAKVGPLGNLVYFHLLRIRRERSRHRNCGRRPRQCLRCRRCQWPQPAAGQPGIDERIRLCGEVRFIGVQTSVFHLPQRGAACDRHRSSRRGVPGRRRQPRWVCRSTDSAVQRRGVGRHHHQAESSGLVVRLRDLSRWIPG